MGVFDAAIIFALCVTTIGEVWKKCGDPEINQRMIERD
ncbi:hypothetical protein J522_0504 [Acinetobacter baumannii 146457]|nr:hypothetical protein J522_0504 [Acinetobacter baumannii 146457]